MTSTTRTRTATKPVPTTAVQSTSAAKTVSAILPAPFALPYPERTPVSSTKGPFNSDVVKYAERDFSWSTTDEPHATRRKLILQAHPEVQSLFVKEKKTFWMVAACVVTQLLIGIALKDSSWYLVLPLSYIIGGTINHALQLASHELSHNLCFDTPVYNKLLAIMSNIPTCMPSAISFQRYHMDHHQYQGVDGIATDIPCALEINYFTSCLLKTVWLFLQPFMYAFRPLLIKPKPVTSWEVINWIGVVGFDALYCYFFGFKSFAYLFAGTILGLGLHPSAGHFVAEHYEFIKGQETYSYYGIMNYVMFNVGYHNEHHDFPRVPWSKLPLLKKMAPEFYDTLPSYDSYLSVFYRYITDDTIGPFSRIKRKAPQETADLMSSQPQCKSTMPYVYLCFGCMTFVIASMFIHPFVNMA